LDKEQRYEMLELKRSGKLPEKINRSSDLFMKFLLGRKARTQLLLDLVNSIFGVLGHPKLKTIELSNIEMGPDYYDKKLSRFDIRGIDESDRQLNVELQKESHSHFISRCLFHWGKNYIQQLDIGRKYLELKPTIMISLLGYDLFKGEKKYVWDFMLINPETGMVLTLYELIIYVEMNKNRESLVILRNKLNENPDYKLTDNDRLSLWSGYIMNNKIGVEIMNEVAARDAIFQEVINIETHYWSNPDNRYAQLVEQLAELDAKAMLDDAEERGIRKGKAEGIAEGIEQMARAMIVRGMEIESISQITGLSFERIKMLQSTNI